MGSRTVALSRFFASVPASEQSPAFAEGLVRAIGSHASRSIAEQHNADDSPRIARKEDVLGGIRSSMLVSSEDEASTLLRALENSGAVHIRSNLVHLRPSELMDMVLHELPHLRAKVLSSQAPQADELEEEVLNDLQAKASKRATLLLGGCLAALGCQFSAFLWLIFYELSWDVMEPISYFFGGGLSVAGYSYALAARQDWSYENLWEKTTRRHVMRAISQHGIPPAACEKIIRERLKQA